MYDATDDPYTYENSTVLVNKLDLREQTALDEFEAEISSARAQEPLPAGNLDFEHYKAIHHHLFQDVYEWAGKVRTPCPDITHSSLGPAAAAGATTSTKVSSPAALSAPCSRTPQPRWSCGRASETGRR